MSTILDALRKLEEERHARTADARSRLLLSPPYQTYLRKRQHSPWKTKRRLFSILGVLLAGFSAGASIVLWRSHSVPTLPLTAIASSSIQDKTNVPPLSPSQETSGQKQILAKTANPNKKEQSQKTTPSPVEQQPSLSSPSPLSEVAPQTDSLDLAHSTPSLTELEAPDSPLPPLAEGKNTASTDTSAVQHSPFAVPPPVPRDPAPPQREVKETAKRSSTPSPAGPKNPQQDNVPYKVLMPNGSTRTVGSLTPPPAAAPSSTTAPGTSLNFLQWSTNPERRIAFLRVNGGPLTMAHEGDTVGGYTVVEIRQDAVELQSGETRMTLRP